MKKKCDFHMFWNIKIIQMGIKKPKKPLVSTLRTTHQLTKAIL